MDNVNIALANTNMLFDFKSTTTSTPIKHGTATARELRTPVKLITLSMVNMATSRFAHPKTFHPLLNNKNSKNTQELQIRDKVAYLTQTT